MSAAHTIVTVRTVTVLCIKADHCSPAADDIHQISKKSAHFRYSFLYG